MFPSLSDYISLMVLVLLRCSIFLIAVSTLISCQRTVVPVASKQSGELSQNIEPGTPVSRLNSPVVTFWENGDFRQGRAPTVLFAIWRDGTMIRRISGRLYIGKVTSLEE